MSSSMRLPNAFKYPADPVKRRATATEHAAVAPRVDYATFGLPCGESEQIAGDEVGMITGEAMRQARIVDFRCPLDQLR